MAKTRSTRAPRPTPTAPAKRPARAAAASAPSTIGHNPLDLLLPAVDPRKRPRAKRARGPAAPAAAPDASSGTAATRLTITVPQGLADQVQSILAVRTDLSFDQLMSSALAEVLGSLRSGQRGRGAMRGSIKSLEPGLTRRR